MEEGVTHQLLHTAADLDAVPDGGLILTIEVVMPGVPHARNRTLWRKYGHGFVRLDPGDRDNGEQSRPSGHLENLLTGFGRARTVPGVGLLLGEGEPIAVTHVSDLPRGSVVQVAAEEFPHIHTGGDNWEYADPGDPYDGDYPTSTANLISGESVLHVLYQPGDEIAAGFQLDVVEHLDLAAAPESTDPTDEADADVEPDVVTMSRCAQAYLAEYGHLPTNRAEQDRYSAFRFGYERGERAATIRAYADVAANARGQS